MFNLSPVIPARNDLDWCWYLRRQGPSGDALERVLHDIGVMNPSGWADWSGSNLTQTGAPVRMIFAAENTDLKLVTEVADPAGDKSTRVDQVCKIITGLGGRPLDRALRDVVSAAQSTGKLAFGAWLGLQHGRNGLRTTLYAELPAAAADLSPLIQPDLLEPAMDELGPEVRATMMGFDGNTGEVTVYYEMPNASRTVLPTLCAPANVSADVLSLSIDGMTEGAAKLEMPTKKLGFSYTMCGVGKPPVLTLYFAAQDLFKTDAVIAERVKACGGRALSGYTSLIDALPPLPLGQTHHGKIGMTARRGAAPALSIDVAAPWISVYDSF